VTPITKPAIPSGNRSSSQKNERYVYESANTALTLAHSVSLNWLSASDASGWGASIDPPSIALANRRSKKPMPRHIITAPTRMRTPTQMTTRPTPSDTETTRNTK